MASLHKKIYDIFFNTPCLINVPEISIFGGRDNQANSCRQKNIGNKLYHENFKIHRDIFCGEVVLILMKMGYKIWKIDRLDRMRRLMQCRKKIKTDLLNKIFSFKINKCNSKKNLGFCNVLTSYPNVIIKLLLIKGKCVLK